MLLGAGLTLLALVAAALAHRWVFSTLALAQFDRAQAAAREAPSKPGGAGQAGQIVDFSLWSEKRIQEYRMSLLIKKDAPLAVLCLDRLRICVPVFEGTDELALNRGVGWIAGTARPGEAGNGNIGIAGHRDGFFRGFKDILLGDEVQLSTLEGVSLYAVDNIEIVSPDNVAVLRPRSAPALTLVTCYPFYFVGDAPQRFIVHATLKRQFGVGKLESGS